VRLIGGISERAWGWIAPLAVAVFAFVVRIWHVGFPNVFVFDETYYAKDAWSLLQHGYVRDFVEDANERITAGNLDKIMTSEPSWIVHPDGGKWLIAIGEQLFGFTSFGWRISGVVIGALTVLVLARMVRRMTGSTTFGCLAGLLLAVDGTHFVMSRLALLDIFLTFWIVCAVACLVADRDWIMQRLDRYRPWRPWQLAAGLCFGMACATKWSGAYALAAFGLTIVAWEVIARKKRPRTAKSNDWFTTTLLVGLPAFGWLVLVAATVYLISWTGFLVHHEVYEARFGHGYGDYSKPWGRYVTHPTGGPFGEAIDALRSLWKFHVMTWDFHTDNLDGADHPYQSHPAGWLLQWRPVGADAQFDLPKTLQCGQAEGEKCVREILILGNPLIWWSGALALIASAVAWIKTRRWVWGLPLIGVAALWLPWFANADRPIFSFYAVAIVPFTIIALTLLAHAAWLSRTTPRSTYAVALFIGAFMVGAVALFWYFHPVLTDDLIPNSSWYSRMWLNRWI
jgi:dolichyl-phosphate-mannose-protein mannosyltransferase